MALSRLAKKFRDQEPGSTPTTVVSKKADKPAKRAGGPKPAAPAPVAAPPPPEPVAPPEPPKPGKRQQEKVKRAKFVYVPEKTERKPLPAKTAVQPPSVTKIAARLMTQNLALPPEEEPGRGPTLPGFGRA